MAEENDTKLREDSEGPKEAEVDGVHVVQHPLPDRIEVDRYLNSKDAAKKGIGVKMTKIRPPGAI